MEKYTGTIIEALRKSDYKSQLKKSYDYSIAYLDSLSEIPVFPKEENIKALEIFDENMPNDPTDTDEILKLLKDYGSRATVSQTGGRYFGFVVGGNMTPVLATRWLTEAWDQNSAMYVHSPITSKLEEISEKWINQLLGFPEETAIGFVTGSSLAIMCGLAAGRNCLLKRMGWDVVKKGLYGAPKLKIIASEEVHSTDVKMLSVLGLGQENIITVPTDDNGSMRMDLLPEMDNRTILILQAGNLHSGSFDDFKTACDKAHKAGAWVHVDGAIGLWARANDEMKHLTKGLELADSYNTDGHKTLNMTYDIGLVLCKNKEALIEAMHMTGDYIILSNDRDNMMYTPEMSRRARGVDMWACLKALGKAGVKELVKELHEKAKYFAKELENNGFEILNEVVFNQISVYYINDEATNDLANRLQHSGILWLGASKWKGKSIIRISLSNYMTTYDDIDICVAEFKKQGQKIAY
jgi:glutamate/tyrosine decarboxylase-like PLP-dependent enzyme